MTGTGGSGPLPIRPLVVLHLRTSSDSGGGPEKTIINTGRLIDSELFTYLIGYLRHRSHDLSPVAAWAGEAGLDWTEFPGRRLFDVAQFSAILRFIRDRGVDILHSHDPKTDCLAVLLRLFRPGLKLVTTLHGWIHRQSFKSGLYLWLDKKSLKIFDRVIAVSAEIEAQARAHGADTVLLHNAIDTDLWRPRMIEQPRWPIRSAGSFMVGYIGRLSPEKGALDFIRAAALVIEKNSHIRFVIAGQGPEEPAAHELTRQMGLEERVRFLGQVDSRHIIGLYAQLDAVLSPSYTEGMPNNLLEACAMEVPVVATRVGGVGDLIRHGQSGLLHEAGDIRGMAESILALSGQPETARAFGRRARETVVEAFSFKDRVQRLQTIYQDLVRIK